MRIRRLETYDDAAARGLAGPQRLLQSVAMSLMRHTVRTGANKPQVSNELVGRQFGIRLIQSPRHGRNARS